MKKVLIFYSETGGGHLRAAHALDGELKRKNLEVVLYDGLKETNWGQKTNPSLVFSIISQYLLPLYNFTYQLTNNSFGINVLRRLIKLIWGDNFKKIIEKEKPDLIITTHHFISPSTFASLDKKFPSVVVVIDLGRPHRIWFDERADYIIVPDRTMATWASKKFKIEASKLKPLGYPLRAAFTNPKPPTLTNTILILGAGIESFLVTSWIKKIRKKYPSKKIVVVCGHNILLQKILSKMQGVQSFGFVDNLHKFLEGSDLVITKAGPGTIMEAAALKKPVILVKWVGFQEKDNVNFVLENKLGLYDPNGKNLILTISKIYKNYKKYTKSQKLVHPDTDKIVDYLLKFIY